MTTVDVFLKQKGRGCSMEYLLDDSYSLHFGGILTPEEFSWAISELNVVLTQAYRDARRLSFVHLLLLLPGLIGYVVSLVLRPMLWPLLVASIVWFLIMTMIGFSSQRKARKRNYALLESKVAALNDHFGPRNIRWVLRTQENMMIARLGSPVVSIEIAHPHQQQQQPMMVAPQPVLVANPGVTLVGPYSYGQQQQPQPQQQYVVVDHLPAGAMAIPMYTYGQSNDVGTQENDRLLM